MNLVIQLINYLNKTKEIEIFSDLYTMIIWWLYMKSYAYFWKLEYAVKDECYKFICTKKEKENMKYNRKLLFKCVLRISVTQKLRKLKVIQYFFSVTCHKHSHTIGFKIQCYLLTIKKSHLLSQHIKITNVEHSHLVVSLDHIKLPYIFDNLFTWNSIDE